MVIVKEKTIVTQRIHGHCPTHARTEISTRDVKTIIDEPKERDGTNMGPSPTETLVAALIACTAPSGRSLSRAASTARGPSTNETWKQPSDGPR